MCFPRTTVLGRGSRWFYVRCASFIEIDLNLVEIVIFRRYLVILRGISIILVVFWSLWSVLGCLCFSTSGWLGCILGCICVFSKGVHKSALFDDIPGLFDRFWGHFRHFEVIWGVYGFRLLSALGVFWSVSVCFARVFTKAPYLTTFLAFLIIFEVIFVILRSSGDMCVLVMFVFSSLLCMFR